jgi:hypothetical protein
MMRRKRRRKRLMKNGKGRWPSQTSLELVVPGDEMEGGSWVWLE